MSNNLEREYLITVDNWKGRDTLRATRRLSKLGDLEKINHHDEEGILDELYTTVLDAFQAKEGGENE